MSQAPGKAARRLVRGCATARSRRPSTSWPACTSSTARSSTASSPTATRRRRSARRACRSRSWRAQGRVDGARGRRQDDRREDRRAARDRLDPVRRQAEAAHPRPAWSRSPASPASGPSARELLHDAARRRPRSTTCARRPRTAGSKDVPGFGAEGRGERARGARGRTRTASAKARMLLSKALRGGRGARRGAARAPVADPRRAGGQRPAAGRHVQGPRHRRGLERPGGARRGVRRACTRSTSVSLLGEAGARAVTHSGLPVDLRDRAGGGVRQPAPALHRLGQAQRGAAHRGGAGAACT